MIATPSVAYCHQHCLFDSLGKYQKSESGRWQAHCFVQRSLRFCQNAVPKYFESPALFWAQDPAIKDVLYNFGEHYSVDDWDVDNILSILGQSRPTASKA